MLSATTIRRILHESLFLAPEQLTDDNFLEIWAKDKFDLGLDELLYSKDEVSKLILDKL